MAAVRIELAGHMHIPVWSLPTKYLITMFIIKVILTQDGVTFFISNLLF